MTCSVKQFVCHRLSMNGKILQLCFLIMTFKYVRTPDSVSVRSVRADKIKYLLMLVIHCKSWWQMTITEIFPWVLGNVKTHHAKGSWVTLRQIQVKCSVYGDGVSSPNLNDVTLHQRRIDCLLRKVWIKNSSMSGASVPVTWDTTVWLVLLEA